MPVFAIESEWVMLAIDIVAWAIIQIGLGFVIFNMPAKVFDYKKSAFLVRESEDEIYRRLRLQSWKSKLPEFPGLGRNRFKKCRMESTSLDYLEKFLIATCRVESVHKFVMLPIILFPLWNSPFMFMLNVIYMLGMNVPYIMIQRYNRPRLLSLIELKQAGD